MLIVLRRDKVEHQALIVLRRDKEAELSLGLRLLLMRLCRKIRLRDRLEGVGVGVVVSLVRGFLELDLLLGEVGVGR